MSFKKNLVRFIVYYEQGAARMAKVRDLVSISAYMMMFQFAFEKMGFHNINIVNLAIAAPVVYAVMAAMTGWGDFKWGIMRDQAAFSTKEANPFMEGLDKKLDTVIQELKK